MHFEIDAPSTIDIQLDKGAYMPECAHEADAGCDIRTPINCTIKPHDSIIVDTGVHMAIPVGFVGFLKSKSGLNVKNNITGEGVIDANYTGSIIVKLYNNGDEPHEFWRGDKLIQIVLLPIYKPNFRQVEKLEDTERGANGFGSTGR